MRCGEEPGDKLSTPQDTSSFLMVTESGLPQRFIFLPSLQPYSHHFLRQRPTRIRPGATVIKHFSRPASSRTQKVSYHPPRPYCSSQTETINLRSRRPTDYLQLVCLLPACTQLVFGTIDVVALFSQHFRLSAYRRTTPC